MSGNNYVSEYMGLAAASTTNFGQTPRYGLVYDLSTGQWQNAAQFRQFVRDTLPATQTVAQQQAQALQGQTLHAQELEKATNYEAHGLFATASDLGVNKSGVGNQIMTGFKAAKTSVGSGLSLLVRGAGDLLHGRSPDHSVSYDEYASKGGLLTEDEFNQFSNDTKLALLNHATAHKDVADFAQLPGIHQAGVALGTAYRGATAGAEVASLALRHAAPSEFFDPHAWAQGWREAQGESLGNALVNIALDPFYTDEQLNRWKRDNPWYQMTSVGTEVLATWYADPSVIVGKGLGASARFARKEMPLNENGAYGRGLGQALANQPITIRNPITKGLVNIQAGRMKAGWENVDDYALAVSAPEFAQLPMWKARYRATDGGAGAFAYHWAVNNRAEANALLNSDAVRAAAQKGLDAFGDTIPSGGLDLVRLQQDLMHGDPRAWAMLNKIRNVSPDELQQIAPGSGTLLDALDALTTKHATLQSEVDDLLDAAKQAGDPRAATNFPEWSHRWEVHTNLAKKQQQMVEVSDQLRKYNGYDEWLNNLTQNDPRVMRVAGPTRSRWSEVRQPDTVGDTEQRSLFMDNQYGAAHSVHRMPKGLFLKRANVAELDMKAGADSGLESIRRQFDQLDHFFGYVPESGARDAALNSYARAKSSYDRYKIMHDLEETHLIGAIAAKFNLSTDTSRALIHKIYEERNRTINGILTGEGQVYRSAPSLASRLAGGTDANLQLVARNEDTGMVTVNLLRGRHKETYEVPEAALQPRVAPQDITQTPNYYNPLDTRRLFYTLKHNRKFLEETEAGGGLKSAAAIARFGEWAGTRFNEFWKPVQLFRLGWPMRVLMDESLGRATAIYGPLYWINGAGAEAVYTSGRNLVPNVANFITRKRKGPLGVEILGPKSTTEKVLGNAPTQFARDAEVNSAVQIPQSLWSKVNLDRYEATTKHVGEFDNWRRENARYDAWQRAEREGKSPFDALLGHTLAGNELTPTQERLMDHAANVANRLPGDRPQPPIFNIASQYYKRNMAHDPSIKHPAVFDHISGREVKSGFVVPLPEFQHELQKRIPGPGFMGIDATHGIAMMKWYADNAEMLSRQGMRVVVDPSGHLTIGRVFKSNEFTKARHYAEYVSEKHPDVRMWNIGEKRSYHIQDVNDLSPIDEATYRRFANEEVLARQPGKAPVEGQPELYHGTDSTLPEDLLPRHTVAESNGRMIGDGLYTTTSHDIAETYGAANLYTIRGSKSGRVYKTWDLDKEITHDQKVELLGFLRDHGVVESDRNLIARLMAEGRTDPGRLTAQSGNPTWANLYEDISTDFGGDDYHALLHQYLEEKHGVGALTHLGGSTRAVQHQVYVWLHPEDLMVKPLYAGTGKYVSLPEWFSHPQSVENLVPENRILRKGIRNPMLRELRTINAKLENYTRKSGTAKYKDPEYNALIDREQALMDALGLDYRGKAFSVDSGTNRALVPDRYVVADKNHFERIVTEARTEDEARALRAAANGDLRAQEVATQNYDLGDFDFDIDSPTDWLLNKIHERHQMGIKPKKVTTSDGVVKYHEGAFAGHRGELLRSQVSSGGTMRELVTEAHGSGTALSRRQSEGWKVIQPPKFTDRALKKGTTENKKAVLYFQTYADTVNDHLGNSPIVQRMSREQSDESIVRWLETTPEGQNLVSTIKPVDLPTGVWVEDIHGIFDHMVPSKKLQRLVGKGRLKPSDFRKNIADEDLPVIYGPNLSILDRNKHAGEILSGVAEKMYNALGTLPVDAISRQPFAKAAFDTKMRALYARTNSKYITPQLEEQFVKEAEKFARDQVKRHLYNLTETTNFNDMLRFVAPFWGAQYEAIQKWLRIISDRPETVARFFAGQRAVYNNFVVVDQDGNKVDAGTRPGGLHGLGLYHPTDQVVMRMPDFLRKRLGPFDTSFVASTRVPIGSANTVLQGDLPLFPSLGPLVTIPVDQFLRRVSDTYAVEKDQNLLYRWLFPIGRPRSNTMFGQFMDQFSPGWVNRVRQAQSAESNQSRLGMEKMIGEEMILKARRQGKPDPSFEQIKKAADHLWNVRILSGIVQPFQTQYLPDHQYWVDAAHKYQKTYGNEWWDKYINDYGEEAAIFATSASNSIGVPPTSQGMEEWSKNKALIQKYPNWTSAIISPQAYMGEFSSDAYAQQFNIVLGPGDTRTLRSGSNLQDRLYTDPETNLGWREFRKLNAAIEAELYARGLHSIQQSGAEDLAQLKRYQVGQIIQKYPAWARAYQTQSDQIYSDIEELKSFVGDKAFDHRPDMLGARQYLQLRQQVTDALDAYGEQGGSRSLQANENSALRQWFYDKVGQLVLENPAFAEFYSRYLSSDTLTLGGGGF